MIFFSPIHQFASFSISTVKECHYALPRPQHLCRCGQASAHAKLDLPRLVNFLRNAVEKKSSENKTTLPLGVIISFQLLLLY